MSYVTQILKGAKGAGQSPALPKPLFADGARALSGALAGGGQESEFPELTNPILTVDEAFHFTTIDGNYYFTTYTS